MIFDLWTGIIIIISFHKSKLMLLGSGWLRWISLRNKKERNVYVPSLYEWILRQLSLHLLHLPSKTHTVPYPGRNIGRHCAETGTPHSNGIVPKKWKIIFDLMSSRWFFYFIEMSCEQKHDLMLQSNRSEQLLNLVDGKLHNVLYSTETMLWIWLKMPVFLLIHFFRTNFPTFFEASSLK